MSAAAAERIEPVVDETGVDHDEHDACDSCGATLCPTCTPDVANVCGHLGQLVCHDCDPSEVCGACYLDRPRGGFTGWVA